ncbi:MAG: hypothetical protein ABIP93_03830 [Gemmatimonadaceae bacterium]
MHDDDEKFDEFLRQATSDYNAPVTSRADAIWAAIEPDVARAIAPKRRFVRVRTLSIGAAAAATLVLGVAIGRWSSPSSLHRQLPTAAATLDSSSGNGRARAVTLDHLADAEVFLTTVRYELESGLPDAERAARSRELLGRTRVLLGASQNRTPEVARLLEDLELLLAEIAALPAPPARSSLDRTLLDESIRDGDVIPRIRATLPARAAGA